MDTMLSMQLIARDDPALLPVVSEVPQPGPGEVLLRVRACGVCRTDLHLVDGDLGTGRLPMVPGHEVVGVVEGRGTAVVDVAIGQRVGVPWLAGACGRCGYCTSGRENLCPHARFTGYHVPGGFATHVVADAAFVVPLPDAYDDLHVAPLLCAGLIGHRAYRMAGQGRRIGLYGFGAAAHIVAQVAAHDGRDVYAFVRPGDAAGADFARDVGAVWAGESGEPPPVALDAAILFAPVGALVPEALSRVVPGGVVVCAGIHMSDIPSFPYRLLWQERIVRSVANLTRADATAFMDVAAAGFLRTHVRPYALTQANEALADLREGRLSGAAVLVPR